MANNGSIDEVIGSEASKQVDVLTEKMNGLYVAFKQNITAINLVNDALSKSVSIKDVSENVDKATKSTKKLKDVQTEFVETVYKLDKAVSDTGHALSDQEVAMAKLTATMANGNKAAKLVSESTKTVTKDSTDLKNAYARLNDEYKASLIHSRNLAVQYGVTSKEFKAAATQTNLMGAELKNIDAQLGIHSKNVGNYADGVTKGLSNAWSGLRKIAYILPGIGIAGLFDVAGEAIGKAVDALSAFGDKSTEMRQVLSSSFDSTEMKTAIENAEKLSTAIDLVASGVMSKKEGVDLYNDTLGKVAGSVKTWDEAETKIKGKLPEYIKFITQKAEANAFLMKSAELTAEAQKEIIDPSFLTKMEALATAFRAGSSWSEAINIEAGNKALALKEKSAKYLDEFKKYYADFQKTMKDNNFVDPSITPKKDTKTPNEVNRITELKNQFEAEKLVIDTAHQEGNTSEVVYRTELLRKIQEYATKKQDVIKNLSQHEKDAQTTLNKELLALTIQSTDAIAKEKDKQIKDIDKFVESKVKANEEEKKVEDKKNKEIYKGQLEWGQRILDNIQGTQKVKINKLKEQTEAEKKLAQDKYEFEMALINSAFSIANSISDAIHAKELQQIEDKATALEEAHNKEIKQIEQSGLTSIQQTKAKAKADAQYEAAKKKIDTERKKALHDEARLNRDLALLEVAIRTAANIVKEFPNPYLMAAAAALGIAQAAAIALKPLPQYAKGRGKGKAEHAIVGEAGQEAIIRENGKVELTPNKATITYLNPNDQVISHHDLIKNAAYVHLAKQGGTVTTDKLQNALINEFERNTEEIKDLKKVLINKNLSVNTTNYSGFDSYLKANIR